MSWVHAQHDNVRLMTLASKSRWQSVPTSVLWGNIGPERDGGVRSKRSRSCWTYQDVPLPFVASDPYWKREHVGGLVSYRSFHERGLVRFASEVQVATISAEMTHAQIVLVAGDSDASVL
jgi:uncharacterized protein